MKSDSAVAYATTEHTEACYPDRDSGAVIVQMNILEEVFESLVSAVRQVERRLEHVINPNSNPVGLIKGEAQESLSPLADRLRSMNDKVRELRTEVGAWTERIEL